MELLSESVRMKIMQIVLVMPKILLVREKQQ